MPIGYQSFGEIWCPSCVCKREFVSYDQDVNDVDDAECGVCSYVHGKRIDDTARRDKGEPDVVRAIPVKVARGALEDKRRVIETAIRVRGLTHMPSKEHFAELERREDNA